MQACACNNMAQHACVSVQPCKRNMHASMQSSWERAAWPRMLRKEFYFSTCACVLDVCLHASHDTHQVLKPGRLHACMFALLRMPSKMPLLMLPLSTPSMQCMPLVHHVCCLPACLPTGHRPCCWQLLAY